MTRRARAAQGAAPALALFFTRGMALAGWDSAGMLDRELSLYRALARRGVRVTLVTYGGRDEARRLGAAEGIRVLSNRWGLPQAAYAHLLPLLHARGLRRADVFKTNQTNGAETALCAARIHRRPLIARCGYMWSEFEARQCGAGSRRARHARRVERKVFASADRVVVTTAAMRGDVGSRVPAARGRIEVIPNYVDTDRLRPRPELRQAREIVFVGRLTEQKNVGALLEAVAGLDAHLTVVGQGPLESELKLQAARLGCPVGWLPPVAHSRLVEIYNGAQIFVQPSLYEGHPKTLIEAMACGLPVVGSRVPGIADLVRDGVNGMLCEPDAGGIRAALETLLADSPLRDRLGAEARRLAVDQFSLDRIAEQEFELLTRLRAQTGAAPCVGKGTA